MAQDAVSARGWSIRSHLAMMVALLLVPAIAFAAVLIERWRNHLVTQAETRLVQLAADLADDISVELERGATILESLSASAAIERADYAALHGHAKRLLDRTGDNFLMYDGEGKPLINTNVPWGTPLTNTMQPVQFDVLAETMRPHVSNLLYGRTRQTWVVHVLYSIVREGRLRYVLVLSLTADRVRRILEAQKLGPDWTTNVSDRNGILIARTRQHEEFVGKPLPPEQENASHQEFKPHRVRSVDGHPIVRVVARTRVGDWTIAAAVSEQALYAGVNAALRDLVLAGVVLLSISALLVAYQGERLAGAVRALAGTGLPRRRFLSPLPVREANEVSALLQQATAELESTTDELRKRDEALRLAMSAVDAFTFSWDIRRDEVRRQFSNEPRLAGTDGGVDTLQGVIDVLHPDDRASFRSDIARTLNGSGNDYRNEYRIVRADGEIRWKEDWGRLERDTDATPLLLFGIVFDVTRQKQAAQGLVESERRFRELADSMPQLVWTANSAGEVDYYNRRRDEYLISDSTATNWSAIIHPDDLDRTRELWRKAVEHNADYECEHRVQMANGNFHWHLSRARPVRHDGELVWYGTATDVNDLKEREDRIRLLMHEVNHRAKNLLAVVLSVARQTSRQGNAEDFVERFTDRVQGLAASHDLLVKSLWRGVDLEDLVRTQLVHYQDLIGTRISIEGPAVKLEAGAAQVIGMALHELATNAAKHGALSSPHGRVMFSWSRRDGIESPRIALSWRERDGPVKQAPQQTGFGHVVLVQIVEHALSGKVDLSYFEGGFSWSVEAPFDRLSEPDQQQT